MKLNFNVKYRTKFGQNIFVKGNCPELGNDNINEAIPLSYRDEETWSVDVEIKLKKDRVLKYSYFIKNEEGEINWDGETERQVKIEPSAYDQIVLTDNWNFIGAFENTFYTTPFKKVLLKKYETQFSKKMDGAFTHKLKVKAPLLKKGEIICLTGDGAGLKNWDTNSPVLLTKKDDWWITDIDLSGSGNQVQYKYGIYNIDSNSFVHFEAGENRFIQNQVSDKCLHIQHDGFVRMANDTWKGTGVSIPVFSLRSKKGFGIGEFQDLKLLVDWAKKSGINLVQILPVNDTTATYTWTDSYPYAAISAFALNPVYINLEKVAGKKNSAYLNSIKKKKKLLNEKDSVDYAQVLRFKISLLKELYQLDGNEFLESKEFNLFFEKNKHWLEPYAAFCFLRDKYKTSHFETWKTHAVYHQEKIAKLLSPKSRNFKDIAFHYFVQYHLHLQLLDASRYAHKNGVVFKGDIPIGIYRYGCDAWVEPDLYNMNMQSGAPPDDFTVKGQNWGFPIYNWKKMKEDDFGWWRKRFEQMSHYFDTFRIDHILGFFRIWSIPIDAVEGILGKFYPAIPVSENEFHHRGINFEINRYTKPFINDMVLNELFGILSSQVIDQFLIKEGSGNYVLKPEFSSQKQVEDYFSQMDPTEENLQLKSGLFELISNVILFVDDERPGYYHFRISMENTHSFRFLDQATKQALKDLYIDYFYRRQDGFWKKEAMQKLPYLKQVTNMLICGEDLGMVPHCVPEVMQELGLLSLEIQRMPKNPQSEFFHPKDAPYLSVVTPSTHDMSTVRGWWEEDAMLTQHFYNNVLRQIGKAPDTCEPWINKAILKQHLDSPAMWCIFQLQDILGISQNLRRADPNEERVNNPANAKHYWQYRMHLNLEDLLKEEEFINELHSCIKESHR